MVEYVPLNADYMPHILVQCKQIKFCVVGEALARMMSEQGARLIISSRNKEELEDIQKSMNNGHNVKFVYISVYM